MAGRIDALLTARAQRVVPPDDVRMDPPGTGDHDIVPDSQDAVGQDRESRLDDDDPFDDGVESDHETVEVDDELQEVPLRKGDDEPYVQLPTEYGLWAREPLAVYVDCRWDSSRNGHHGTVPFINAANDRVIEMVTMTRVEASSSWNIETRAVERGTTSLLEKGIAISEIIHDDNRVVDSIIDRYEILNQKDLWHKCKNIIESFKILQDAKVTTADRSIVDARSWAELAVFTNDMLKQYCRSQQLPVSGTKVTLINRIAEHLGLAVEEYHTVECSRGLKYPELAAHDIAYKLKSWIYTCCRRAKTRGDSRPELMVFDICTAAQHWACDHSDFCILPGNRPCGQRQFGDGARFPHGGATHLVVKAFLEEHVTAAKMSVRKRPTTTRVLVCRTAVWKNDIKRIVFGE
ncbi:hypothetical protein R1sor_013815 [Riccia sorocarpa]|uniref:SAP domain-containing protein n=1 Tax=Riccia sorocarpa TaxID=122646 RepID=A0ABD3HBS3_9MARC